MNCWALVPFSDRGACDLRGGTLGLSCRHQGTDLQKEMALVIDVRVRQGRLKLVSLMSGIWEVKEVLL